MFRILDVNPGEELDRNKGSELVHRHHRIVTVGVLLLVPALAGSGWYAYQALQRHEVALRQIPGIEKFADAIGSRLKQNDLKLASLADDQQSFRDQIANLGRSMEARIASVTKQAQASSADIYRRVEADIDERLQHVDARLTHIESSSEIQEARIAKLQRELEEVRRHAVTPATMGSKIEEDSASH
jgi:uncharacterized protein YdcH (DUF465 family)